MVLRLRRRFGDFLAELRSATGGLEEPEFEGVDDRGGFSWGSSNTVRQFRVKNLWSLALLSGAFVASHAPSSAALRA